MATGMVKDLEEPYQLAGQEKWAHTIKVPYCDGQGRVIGVVGIYEDITERQLAEEALKRSELTYREIFESVNDAIFVHDADSGRILDVNRKMCEIYSYTYEEALMVEVGDLSDPDCYLFSQVQAQEYMRRAKSGPQSFESES